MPAVDQHVPARLTAWAGMCTIVLASSALAELAIGDAVAPSVGITATTGEIILPGNELEARPITDYRQPLVVRITKAFPHVDAYRYQFEYYGLEPGEFNLADYLRRKDGSAVDDLPEIPIRIVGVLPPGPTPPHELPPGRAPWVGGYRLLLVFGGIVWVIGLVVLLRINRKKPLASASDLPVAERSLAERLRPLVEAAADGTIGDTQRAELERMLLAYWRDRLDLQDLPPAQAMTALKQDPAAGGLLKQLEAWLHDPAPKEPVDVVKLLAPYRQVDVR